LMRRGRRRRGRQQHRNAQRDREDGSAQQHALVIIAARAADVSRENLGENAMFKFTRRELSHRGH
jgi:hypothetical protein